MPSNAGWKTGEQLEYLLANWDDFKHAQNMKKLDPFWQRVFDGWHRLWLIPLPRSSHGGEPPENLRLMAQKATNVVRIDIDTTLLSILSNMILSSKLKRGSTIVAVGQMLQSLGVSNSNSTPTRREC